MGGIEIDGKSEQAGTRQAGTRQAGTREEHRIGTLVKWKRRRDIYQDSDSVSGMGDEVEEFADVDKSPSLAGNVKHVNFISKDETNASVIKRFKNAGKTGRKVEWW